METLIEAARKEGIEIIELILLAHIGEQLLLVERSFGDKKPGLCEPIIVRIKEGESLTQALSRGVIEETGAHVEKIEAYLGHRDFVRESKRGRELTFVVTLVEPYEIESRTHTGWAWVKWREAIGYPLSDERRKTIDLFAKWLNSSTSPQL